MTKAIKNILISLLVLVALVFVLRKMNIIPSFKEIFAPRPVLIDKTPILIQQVKQIGQLMTVTVFDEIVMDSIKYAAPDMVSKILQMTVPGSMGANYAKVVLIAKGKVIAGIDLQKLTDKDVFIDKDSVAVTLPASGIFDIIINPSDVTTFSETGVWTPGEIAIIKSRMRLKLLQRAIAQDIIGKANNQSIAIMENFLKTLGYKKVTVNLKI